jgi:hypothetical protein
MYMFPPSTRPAAATSRSWSSGVTRRGEDWLNRKTAVPKYARIYDGRLLSLTGPLVTVDEALARGKFRLDDLMKGI